jgi:transposase
MGRPYSEDLRIRIVAAVEAGASRSAAARQFGVSISCAIKLLQRWRRTGSVAPEPRGRKPYALADDEALVRELVATRPDMTLDELHAELGQRGIRVGRSSIGRFLLARGLTLKKVAARRRATTAGCRGCARGLARWPSELEPGSAGLYR